MVHSYVNLVDREERVDEGEEDEDDDEEEDEEEAEEVGGLATCCRVSFSTTVTGLSEMLRTEASLNACVHLQYWQLMLQRANINRSDDRESQTRVKDLQIIFSF